MDYFSVNDERYHRFSILMTMHHALANKIFSLKFNLEPLWISIVQIWFEQLSDEQQAYDGPIVL